MNKDDEHTMIAQNTEKLRQILGEANDAREKLVSVATMLQPQEQRLLYLLAREYYTGKGAIFDGGICLGGCTESFARGLAARDYLPEKDAIIHAYELGIADEDYVTQFIFDAYKMERHKGDSFVDIIEKNIEKMPGKEKIRFYPGDILEKEYPDTFEIMFLDVCKTQKINYAMQLLFNRLIPGESVLIQQDYIHSWHPYIHATLGYLKDYLIPIGIAYYSSFVFLLKKEIPQHVLEVDPYDAFPIEQVNSFITAYYDMFDEKYRNHMEMVRAMMFFEKGKYWQALEIVNSLKGKGNLPWDFNHTKEYIENNIRKASFLPLPFLSKAWHKVKTIQS